MLNKETLKIFSDLIFKELGIVFKESNYYQLETRLENILQQQKMTIEQLIQSAIVERKQETLNQIYDIATNNETSFFRDPKVFQSLLSHFIKPFFEQNKGKTLQVWSVACSTGQEPYSISMDLENYRAINKDAKFRILATDYSSRVLKKAQEGVYSQVEVQRGMSAVNLVRYFEKIDARENLADVKWKVKAPIQANIEFRHFNLLAPTWNLPAASFDLILCRNVLIYQDQNNRKEILKKLAQMMGDDGCLVLGCAEAITNLPEQYSVQQLGDATVYRHPKFLKKLSQVA